MQPGVKIVAISGAFGPERQQLASTLGVKAALRKHIEREHLLQTVHEVLKG